MRMEQELNGAGVILRSYRKSDLPFVTRLWFDPENNRYLSDPASEFVDETFQAALDGLEDSAAGYYFIVLCAEDREPIGTCGAFPDESRAVWDIGYCIDRPYWRQGYGTQSVGRLLSWIQGQGGQAVTAEVADGNAASGALLRKLGFKAVRASEFRKYNMDVRFKSHIYRKTW